MVAFKFEGILYPNMESLGLFASTVAVVESATSFNEALEATKSTKRINKERLALSEEVKNLHDVMKYLGMVVLAVPETGMFRAVDSVVLIEVMSRFKSFGICRSTAKNHFSTSHSPRAQERHRSNQSSQANNRTAKTY